MWCISWSSLMTRKKCVAVSAYAQILPSVVWYVAHSQQQHAGCEKRDQVTSLSHTLHPLSADLCVRLTEGGADQPPCNHRKCPFISLIHIFVLASAAPSLHSLSSWPHHCCSLCHSLCLLAVEQGKVGPDLDGVLTNSNKNNPAWYDFNLQSGFDAVICGVVEQISH